MHIYIHTLPDEASQRITSGLELRRNLGNPFANLPFCFNCRDFEVLKELGLEWKLRESWGRANRAFEL